MATTSRSRPCVEVDIHDDNSHKPSTSGPTTAALGELPLNNIHNIKPRYSSIESLARQLDNFHIHTGDKENKSRLTVQTTASSTSVTVRTKEAVSENLGNNPLALASQQLPSTKEQLSRHQEGQFEWLLSIPATTGAAKGRRPRSDSHGDAELRPGEQDTLYFGCNLVRRRSQSGGALDKDHSADVYTLLATRIEGVDEFAMNLDAEIERLQGPSAQRLHHGEAVMDEHRFQSLDVPKSPGLVVEVREVAGDESDRSRPLSRIEDSVEALDKLEEEIEALSQVAQMDRVFSPEAAAQNGKATSAQSTPLKRAASVRTGADSARGKLPERSSSVRKPADDEAAAATSPARKVPRPTSLLPPKPPARSSKPPTVPAFELPGEAVARRLKEQREKRRSQQVSSEQAAALTAAYSPSKPHFKSSKPPTRPTFELPGDAISRRKREELEARLRAQEEEDRRRREFKARPIRASVVAAPSAAPRETLASLARKSRATEGSSDSATTTMHTPVAKKRISTVAAATFSSASRQQSVTPTTTASQKYSTLPTRGRNTLPVADPTDLNHTPTSSKKMTPATSRATSTSAGSVRSVATTTTTSTTTGSKVSAEDAAQQKQRGKEVFARDNAYTAERERERRERENAAKVAREKAAERSREMSRLWAEKQRVKSKRREG